MGSDLHRSWEISVAPDAVRSDGARKVNDRNRAIYAAEKSDTPIVLKKPPNKARAEEVVEGRGVAKGNVGEFPTVRTQSREAASMGLKGICEAAKRSKEMKFTALLHHITPELLVESFYALKRNAAAGVNGVTWREYEAIRYR